MPALAPVSPIELPGGSDGTKADIIFNNIARVTVWL